MAFQRLQNSIAEFGEGVKREANFGLSRLNDQWADIRVQCPDCAATLKPPADSRVFSCSHCGASITRPSLDNRLSFHARRFANRVGSALSDGVGKKRSVAVTLPYDVAAGEVVRVSTGDAQTEVTIPRAAKAGERVVVTVPPSAVGAAPLVARKAPAEAPFAEEAVSTAPRCARRQQEAMDDNASERSTSTSLVGSALDEMNQGLKNLEVGMRIAWNDVKVKCPNCLKILEVPEDPGCKVFACVGCDTRINRPDTFGKLNYHGSHISKQLQDVVDSVMGTKKFVQVFVPPGARAGDTINVPGRHGHVTPVVVPEGVEPGQRFRAEMPAHHVAEHVAVAAEAAPAVAPVAETMLVVPSSAIESAEVDSPATEAPATSSMSAALLDSGPRDSSSKDPP